MALPARRSRSDDQRFSRSCELGARLRALVPGGAHTYAKGDDQFPDGLAPVIARGRGCRVWDVDGNEFVEWGNGLRAVALGHGHPAVAAAVAAAVRDGTNFVRPSSLELEAAEALLELLPAADMVKFTKDGSTANTAAVRLARAATGRDLVAVCADHPFFSYDDWFIATTPMDAGIPAGVAEQTVRFGYNDLASVEALFASHPDRIACVVLEPERTDPAGDGFLPALAQLCRRNGALLVLDENVTGFRWHLGGAQAMYGVRPDLSTFGKAMANGIACSALVGRRELMELGGFDTDRDRVFLLSTTHGAEHVGLAAAVATIGVYRAQPVIDTLWRQGERLRDGVGAVIAAHGLTDHVQVVGREPCLFYVTRGPDGTPSQLYRTLFLQELIGHGVLAPSFVVSAAHTDADVDRTIGAVDATLAVYAQALDRGVERVLRGRPVKPAMRRSA
jgi:glutamate-1-semialdehyde 2,1-aminomutase